MSPPFYLQWEEERGGVLNGEVSEKLACCAVHAPKLLEGIPLAVFALIAEALGEELRIPAGYVAGVWTGAGELEASDQKTEARTPAATWGTCPDGRFWWQPDGGTRIERRGQDWVQILHQDQTRKGRERAYCDGFVNFILGF